MKSTGQEYVIVLAQKISDAIDDEQQNHALLALLLVLEGLLDQMLEHADEKTPTVVRLLHSLIADLTATGLKAHMPFRGPIQ